MSRLPVAPDDLGEAERERPLRVDRGDDFDRCRPRQIHAGSSTSPVVVKNSPRASGVERVAPPIERRQPIELDVVDVHVRVELVGVVELEHVHFAEDALAQALIAQIVEQIERAIAEARRRKIRRHRLPSGAEVARSRK